MLTTEAIIQRLKKGNAVGLARAITWVENRKKGYQKILEAIYPIRRHALRLGITGAPGSGKSSLVDRLLEQYRGENHHIGVLAVDPSSPLSGGALLGDRIRMIQHSNDPKIYIRSMASRGYLGGIASAASEIIDLMEASGKDIIIIETVGVGQSEIDVIHVSDLVLTVLTPTSGDEIQVYKAGIMEITDLFIINKADLGGAENKVKEIENYFAQSSRPPKIVQVSAKENQGISQLVEAIDSVTREKKESIDARKEQLAGSLVLRIVQEKIRETVEGNPEFQELLKESGDHNLYSTADSIYRKLISGGVR